MQNRFGGVKLKLILSDRPLSIQIKEKDIKFYDLSALKITNCMGCFGCWTKTPGSCVIRDDAVKIYPEIARSEALIYVSRIKYGGYDSIMKTMLERAIPVQKAFIRIVNGETHHVQRGVVPKKAVIIGYGQISREEKEIFEKIISRNAYNMCFESYKIVFTSEEDLENIVSQEVAKWEM